MRSPIVGLDLIRVKVFLGGARELNPDGGRELKNVLARGGHDAADARGKAAVVFAVLTAHGVPKHQVLRVERALGHRWLVAEGREADTVSRRQHVKPARLVSDNHDLVTLVGRAVRVGVLERGGVGRVAADAFEELRREDDVVGLGFVELKQAQFRPAPVYAVIALGVAEHPGMIRQCLGRLATVSIVQTAVVHTVNVAVLEDTLEGTCIAFPFRVRPQHDLASFGPVQLQTRSPRHGFD